MQKAAAKAAALSVMKLFPLVADIFNLNKFV
jgi:hypothetical protein